MVVFVVVVQAQACFTGVSPNFINSFREGGRRLLAFDIVKSYGDLPMGKFIRVDMTSKAVDIGKCPEQCAGLAGGGLTFGFIADEVKPTCHPLGKNNKRIFAPGFLTGTTAANSRRISCGAKSPLTGGIKDICGFANPRHPTVVGVIQMRRRSM